MATSVPREKGNIAPGQSSSDIAIGWLSPRCFNDSFLLSFKTRHRI